MIEEFWDTVDTHLMLVNKKLLIDLRGDSFLSNPQLSHNSAKPNITLSWVRHENYFAHHLTDLTTPPHKLNVSNISAVTDPILMKL